MSIQHKRNFGSVKGVVAGLVIMVALCLVGCDNPVGGAENNPLADFAGKTYKSQYRELFFVSAADTVQLGFGTDYNTVGKIVASKSSGDGTVYLLECSQHKNHGAYQYPDFNETNPHSGCYLPVHIRSISANSVEWATFYTKVEGKDTTCFAASSKERATEYLDFSKWDAPYAYSTGTTQ